MRVDSLPLPGFRIRFIVTVAPATMRMASLPRPACLPACLPAATASGLGLALQPRRALQPVKRHAPGAAERCVCARAFMRVCARACARVRVCASVCAHVCVRAWGPQCSVPCRRAILPDQQQCRCTQWRYREGRRHQRGVRPVPGQLLGGATAHPPTQPARGGVCAKVDGHGGATAQTGRPPMQRARLLPAICQSCGGASTDC